MSIEALQTDQAKKTPVSNGPNSAPFFFRFGLDRSRDTQKSDQPGQDCISVQWTAIRLAATLCDGVSQSFFGELAAAELSNKLSQFLLAMPNESDPTFLHDTIRAFLDTLSSTFSRTVEEVSLEHIEPAFLRAVLEKKRNLGSEAVFTAVLLDKTIDRVLLVWAGDCRLRLWLRGEEVTRELLRSEDFITQERWSSSKGVVGSLHLALFPTSSFDTIMTYSDGLSLLDDIASVFQESNVAIEHYVSQTKSLASSDDVSFLQISTLAAEKTQHFSATQLPALRVTEQGSLDFVQIQWQDSQQVRSWEVVANSETGFARLESTKNVVKVPKAEIPSGGAWLAYRGKTSTGFTSWSSWKFYTLPRSAKKLDAEDSSQKKVPPAIQQSPTGYRPLPPTNNAPPTGSGSVRAPSYNGSTNFYPPQQQTRRAPPPRQPSDRRWQFALLALLMGVVVMGSLLIFGGPGEEPDPTPPVQRATMIFSAPTENPIMVDSANTTQTPAINTLEMTEAINTITPTTVIDNSVPEIFKGMDDIESIDVFIVDDTYLGRPFFRSEVVSP